MKIQTINSIETSSLCNNKCEYCPYPEQHKHRETGLMSMEVFEAALGLVRACVGAGTQRELNLFGVGEPTLNPNIVEMVRMARRVLPLRLPVHLNTNGNTMTEALARDLKDAGVSEIDITGHNARAAAKTIRIFQKVGIRGQLSLDFITGPNNWAGQVDWFEPEYHAGLCPWLNRGQVMVMSNGDVTRCCLDAFGKGVFGTVFDTDIMNREITPFELCRTCHHDVSESKIIRVA